MFILLESIWQICCLCLIWISWSWAYLLLRWVSIFLLPTQFEGFEKLYVLFVEDVLLWGFIQEWDPIQAVIVTEREPWEKGRLSNSIKDHKIPLWSRSKISGMLRGIKLTMILSLFICFHFIWSINSMGSMEIKSTKIYQRLKNFVL